MKRLMEDKQGALSIPALLFVGIATFAILGLVHLRIRWNGQLELQLGLDRCTSYQAVSLMSSLNRIEHLNKRMKFLRAGIMAATVQPEVIPALKASLEATAFLQKTVILQYQKKLYVDALLRSKCGSFLKSVFHFPHFPYQRLPRDWVGERPLVLPKSKYVLKVQSRRLGRSSAVEMVYSGELTNKWTVRWSRYADYF